MAGRRGFETVRDMVLSLGVVLGFVGLILLMTLRQTPEAVKVVDAKPVLQAVALNSPYATVVPRDIAGWRVTSARVSAPGDVPFRWHLGYYTSSGQYAAVGQSNGSSTSFLRDENVFDDVVGTVSIAGTTWTKRQRADGKHNALVRTSKGVTTLVTGSGSFDELVGLVKKLEPGSRAAIGESVPPTPSG